MAHHKSAKKRIRTAENKRLANRQKRSKLSTLIKAVRQAKNKEEGEKALARVIPVLDKMGSIRIIHPNKASNQKSKLSRFVNNL